MGCASVHKEDTVSKFNEGKNGNLIEEEKGGDRAERKRCREKQRRLDINYQFSELTTLLQKIDAEDENDCENPRKRFKFSSSSPMNRIDLIAKTISIISRIHSENRKMKVSITETEAEITGLKKKTTEAKENMNKSGQMVMMVPMMMPNGSQTPGMSQAAFMQQAAPFMQQAAPFMQQAAPFMSQSMNFCSM